MCEITNDGTEITLCWMFSEMREWHTLRATRCTTCWGSLSRITLKEAVKHHSTIPEAFKDIYFSTMSCWELFFSCSFKFYRPWSWCMKGSRTLQVGNVRKHWDITLWRLKCCIKLLKCVLTYPPSTISSTARKRPSIFSNKALLSTFFLPCHKTGLIFPEKR